MALGDGLAQVPAAPCRLSRLEQGRLGCVLMLVLMVLSILQPKFKEKEVLN